MQHASAYDISTYSLPPEPGLIIKKDTVEKHILPSMLVEKS